MISGQFKCFLTMTHPHYLSDLPGRPRVFSGAAFPQASQVPGAGIYHGDDRWDHSLSNRPLVAH